MQCVPAAAYLRIGSQLSAIVGTELAPCVGQVCLSLLGTWSGPSWVPGESTILQVRLPPLTPLLASIRRTHLLPGDKADARNARRMCRCSFPSSP